MNLTITNDTCEDIVYNGNYLEKLYYNGDLVWEKTVHNYEEEYLTIEIQDNRDNSIVKVFITVTNDLINSQDPQDLQTFSYSVDGGNTWKTYNIHELYTLQNTSYRQLDIYGLSDKSKILFKGEGDRARGIQIYCRARAAVYGNAMSLLYGDNFIGQTTFNANYALAGLFRGYITDASNLILPATTLTPNCYNGMFSGCYVKKLSKTLLPATTLALSCYNGMFSGCDWLEDASTIELPATTLAPYCYMGMFKGCRALTKTPELPATTLSYNCYQEMFQSCKALTKTPELPATRLAEYCYYDMFSWCYELINVPEILPSLRIPRGCYKSMFAYCKKLVNAPILPAQTLNMESYYWMFKDCYALKKIICYATQIKRIPTAGGYLNIENCVFEWTRGAGSVGDFYKPANMTQWTTGKSGIPDGWTVHNITN